MLSVNNRRQTPISSAVDIQTKVSGQESAAENVSPADSFKTDSVTISKRPEKTPDGTAYKLCQQF